ncbi:MAG: Lrp/AsnC family transcriptional regulator [Fidelibacterota bacterium]
MVDTTDRAILMLLQQNSRVTASEIAVAVKLSVPAVTERLKKLVECGIIKRYTAQLDFKRLGFDLTAFITLVSSSSEHYQEIVSKAVDNPAILECHSVTGEGSHLLKVRVLNSSALERLLLEIQSWPGVIRTHTSVVMSTYKEDVLLNLNIT